jgi:hypothetical protein
MLNIEKQVELAEVVCGKNGRWKVSQAEAASELGGRWPGATGCGGWKRDEGWEYEDGQKRTSGRPFEKRVEQIQHSQPIK